MNDYYYYFILFFFVQNNIYTAFFKTKLHDRFISEQRKKIILSYNGVLDFFFFFFFVVVCSGFFVGFLGVFLFCGDFVGGFFEGRRVCKVVWVMLFVCFVWGCLGVGGGGVFMWVFVWLIKPNKRLNSLTLTNIFYYS